MRMADGGYRPAYNAQLTTDCATQVIVGVGVTNQGTDKGWLGRAVSEVEARYGVRPSAALADGGFQVLDDIEALEKQGTRVYLPPPEPRWRSLPLPAVARGQCRARPVASSDGASVGEGDLQGTGSGVRVRERTAAPTRPSAVSGPRSSEGPRCAAAPRARTQPSAIRGPARTDRGQPVIARRASRRVLEPLRPSAAGRHDPSQPESASLGARGGFFLKL